MAKKVTKKVNPMLALIKAQQPPAQEKPSVKPTAKKKTSGVVPGSKPGRKGSHPQPPAKPTGDTGVAEDRAGHHPSHPGGAGKAPDAGLGVPATTQARPTSSRGRAKSGRQKANASPADNRGAAETPQPPQGLGGKKLSEVLAEQRAKASLGEIPKPDEDIVSMSRSDLVKGMYEYQQNSRGPHGVIRARAGTGKTFTSVLSVAWTYRDQVWREVVRNLGFDPEPSPQQAAVWDFVAQERPRSVRYIAFNRSIVKAFTHQYAWLVQALGRIGVEMEFSTIHSMCFKVCAKAFRLRYGSTTKWKTRRLLEQHWGKDLNEIWKEKQVVINAVEDLVRYAKINLAYSTIEPVVQTYGTEVGNRYWLTDEVFTRLAFHYQVDLGSDEEEIKRTTDIILDKSLNNTQTLDFEDQILFPHIYNLRPWHKADLGLVDEAQDLNKAQQECCFRFLDRIVIVGDEAQAIYGFAGADVDSIPLMEQRLRDTDRGVDLMELTVTRRCGKVIVQEAQAIVPDFEAHESNPNGVITRMGAAEAKRIMKDSDMVLCRLNAPIVALAFSLIRQERKCHIQGRDLGHQLKTTVKNSKCKEPGDFLDWLDKYEETEVARLQKKRNADPDVLIALQDKCACLRIFFEGAKTMEEVIGKGGKIDKIFQLEYEEGTEPNEGVKLSSVHRAKGLEAKKVFILRPEKMPHPMAKTPWACAQEMNLKYVAITRAIEELVWVRTESKEESDD